MTKYLNFNANTAKPFEFIENWHASHITTAMEVNSYTAGESVLKKELLLLVSIYKRNDLEYFNKEIYGWPLIL